jgi:putative sugar O-methyltransferase
MSSISNNQRYPNFCKEAVDNFDIFKNFKRSSSYNEILEHVTYEEGVEYLQQLTNKDIIDNIEKFKINDIIGKPITFNYDNIGNFSPTTLRYVKVLNDLSQININNLHIVEIGVGYGGQYSVLRQLFKPKKYTFIDLPSVINLTRKYITELKLDDIELEYIDGTSDFTNISSDLVISNYAFSECAKDIQDMYIDKVVNNSQHCYMIYNNMNGYSHQEFIQKIKNHKVKVNREIPQTHPKNVLITW